MAVTELLVRALIALAIGELVGLEREHHSSDTLVLAGARTYPLLAIFGFFTAYLSTGDSPAMPYIFHIALIIVALFSALLTYIRFKLGHYGITSQLAMILTFVSGGLLGIGSAGLMTPYVIMAVFISVVMTFLLIEKSRIHDIARDLSSSEIVSAAEFMLILLVIYPLAVSINEPLDPYGIIAPGGLIDPGFLLTIVIIVSLITFGSFLMVKRFGSLYGVVTSGIFGGLMSTEATTATVTQLSRENPDHMDLFYISVILTLLSLYIKTIFIVLFIDPTGAIIRYLAIPTVIMTVLIVVVAYTGKKEKLTATLEELEYPSPFAVKLALQFAVVFTIITSLTRILTDSFGSIGIYVMSIGGIVSTTAVAASVVHQATLSGTIPPNTVATTVLLSIGLSILNKLAIVSPSRELFNRVKYKIIFLAIATFGCAAMPLLGITI